MMWKLITLGVIVAFGVECTHFEYGPKGNPCILADINLNNTLTRTEGNKTESIPTFSLEGASVLSGKCDSAVKRAVTLKWGKDDATIEMDFVNDSNSVSLMLVFAFVPFKVWKTGSNNSVTMVASLEVGHTDKSFQCSSPQVVHFNATQDAGGATYEADWSFLDVKVQAYGVEKGAYSQAEHCAQDMSTSESPTTEGPTTQTPKNGTTEHSNATTEHTTQTTKHTTEHGNGTTEATNGTTEHTTMTTAPVTTTASPSAHPKNTYTFNDKMNQSCVLLQAQILFKISYPNGSKPAEIGIPDEKDGVQVTGDCNYTGKGLDMMEIRFRKTWMLRFVFANSHSNLKGMLGVDDSNAFWWHEVTLQYTYDEDVFPGIFKNMTGKTVQVSANFSGNHQFEADMDGSYICNSDTTTALSDDVKMETWDLQYFAFENKKKFGDDKINQCTADSKTNSVVPIAVGAALAGLVVIVLIAYLIGRRRNRKGYESV